MFANLIGSIAIACAVAFGGAVSNAKEEQANFGAGFTSVKGAYYDPNGEYGTENGRLYVYTEETLYATGSFTNPSVDLPISATDATIYYGYSSGRNLTFKPNSEASMQYNYFWDGTQNVKTFDIYIDGSFAYEAPNHVGGPSTPDYLYNICESYSNMAEYTSISYVWVFNHQEPVLEEVNIVGDIAEGLTGGIVPIAEGLGSGFQDLMRNIFLVGHVDATTNQYVVDGLSTFGIVVVCFAGLALALGLSRWIVNFVGSLGARDR